MRALRLQRLWMVSKVSMNSPHECYFVALVVNKKILLMPYCNKMSCLINPDTDFRIPLVEAFQRQYYPLLQAILL
jgi:hypothetical protein